MTQFSSTPETFYVTVEVPQYDPDSTEGGVFSNVSAENIEIIGLDTPNPIMRVNDMVFQGSYSNILGSDLICDAETGKAQYVTHKRLVMQQIFVEDRTKVDEEDFGELEEDSLEEDEQEEESGEMRDEEEGEDEDDESRERQLTSEDMETIDE